MDKPESQKDLLEKWLAAIDEQLAGEGVPPADRPLQAALRLILSEILEVSTDEGQTKYENDGSTDFVVTPWFRKIYKFVENWYRDRFGSAFDVKRVSDVGGMVFIRGTPFAIRVPTSRVRPDEPGKTVWLSFPDRVSTLGRDCVP